MTLERDAAHRLERAERHAAGQKAGAARLVLQFPLQRLQHHGSGTGSCKPASPARRRSSRTAARIRRTPRSHSSASAKKLVEQRPRAFRSRRPADALAQRSTAAKSRSSNSQKRPSVSAEAPSTSSKGRTPAEECVALARPSRSPAAAGRGRGARCFRERPAGPASARCAASRAPADARLAHPVPDHFEVGLGEPKRARTARASSSASTAGAADASRRD